MTYVVKKGDNLTKIAKQNGLTLKQLLSLNKNIENPDYIQIGQKINLTNSSPTGKKIYDNNDGYPITPKNISPSWNKVTKGAGNPATVANFNKTPEKKAPIKKQVTQKEEPGFLDFMKNKIYEVYQDAITVIDQQTSKKVVAKPKVKIDDSFIDYGYKELGTYKDQSFKAGKNDSLLSAMNVFDNNKGFDYIVSPKVKEGKKTFNNVKGVAHFLMDSDITPNQKYTTPYIEKGNNIVKSAQAGKFTPYLGTSPDDYVMYYKNTGNDKVNVKYGQLKDKDKYKGYEQIKVRSVPFGELDFNNKKSAGFAKKASYIGTLDGKQTSIITDPESNDVYGRFSGGSGIFYFKEPKTGKTISVDVSGSVNTIKQVGEELSKKYNVDPKQLQFLYHDMGSYSAKPKSHNGVLSNEQWQNYNVNNKGYSGAALMYPMEFGGMAASDNVDMGYYSNPLKYFAARGINISDDDCLECGGKIKYPFGGYAEMGFDTNDYYSAIANERPRDSATSYQQDVKGKFNWLNTLAKTPIEQIQKDIDSIPLTKNYMLNKTPKGYFNVYDKNNKPVGYSIDGKTLVPQEPNFEDGGLVRAWIQKFMKGGYIAEGGYPNAQELTQSTTNYYNWGNYNNSFVDPASLNQNPFNVNKQQMQVPMAQSNIPQNIGTNYKMDFNASNDEVNKGNAMADSMMGGKNISKLNPVSLASNIADTTMQFGTDMIGAFAKPESKAAGFAQGAQKAGAATKSLDKIPFVNFFSKLIGGALGARTQGIKNEEMDKYNKIQEYNSRNSVAIGQPSYYGQTHSKYGSNIKNLEQRIIDDIFSDFDKYMKLT